MTWNKSVSSSSRELEYLKGCGEDAALHPGTVKKWNFLGLTEHFHQENSSELTWFSSQKHMALPSNWENLGKARISGCYIPFMALQSHEMLQKTPTADSTSPKIAGKTKFRPLGSLEPTWSFQFLGKGTVASALGAEKALKTRSGIEARRRKGRLILLLLKIQMPACLFTFPASHLAKAGAGLSPGRVIPEGSSLGKSFLFSAAAFGSYFSLLEAGIQKKKYF